MIRKGSKGKGAYVVAKKRTKGQKPKTSRAMLMRQATKGMVAGKRMSSAQKQKIGQAKLTRTPAQKRKIAAVKAKMVTAGAKASVRRMDRSIAATKTQKPQKTPSRVSVAQRQSAAANKAKKAQAEYRKRNG